MPASRQSWKPANADALVPVDLTPGRPVRIVARREETTIAARLPDGTLRARERDDRALAVLSVALKKAVEWDVIERMPCRIQLLVPKSSAHFHDFEQYERLVETASALDRQTELIVLLGGDAGIGCGEIRPLSRTSFGGISSCQGDIPP